MKRRIFFSIYTLSIASILIVSAVLCFLFYSRFSAVVREELKARTEALSKMEAQAAEWALNTYAPDELRITMIDPNGSVIYDNMFYPNDMQNHMDREEVKAALTFGSGESRRYSNTWGRETYYYAVRLTDGSILRVAKTAQSIVGMLSGALPVVILTVTLVSLIGYWIAGRLTRRIVSPINHMDLHGAPYAPYDELAPMVKTIADQRKNIDKQLLDLQNRSITINAIMDNMNEGILLINQQGTILSANQAVLRIFEKKETNLAESKNIVAFLRDMALIHYVQNALTGSSEEMNMSRAGRTYRLSASHVSDMGVIILFWDVTEKVKSEKMRREFSANVSHELRTPLTSLYGYAEMLCGGIVKEEDKPVFYRRIKDEAGRLIALIQDIIMISRLDEDNRSEQLEDVDLTGIAAQAVEALAQNASANQIHVTISGTNIRVRANPPMMYELFYNLIDNAIKYNKPGGSVHIELNAMDNQPTIIVSDTGIGIPRKAQDRVFERFYRVDKSRFRETGGTGLGLAIVKHIVMTHDGKIELQSQIDKGTVIAISFPALSK